MIPARNESGRVGRLVRKLRAFEPGPALIVVVDNGSGDATAEEAKREGADIVIKENRVGKGFAVRAGVRVTRPGHVFVCDADVDGLSREMLQQLNARMRVDAVPIGRLAIGRSDEGAPVTTVVGRPLIDILMGKTNTLLEPLGGLVLLQRDFLLEQHLPGGWGFDIALTLRALDVFGTVPEIVVKGVSHRQKPLSQYAEMSHQVISAALISKHLIPWDHSDCILCAGEQRQTTQPDSRIGRLTRRGG